MYCRREIIWKYRYIYLSIYIDSVAKEEEEENPPNLLSLLMYKAWERNQLFFTMATGLSISFYFLAPAAVWQTLSGWAKTNSLDFTSATASAGLSQVLTFVSLWT